LLSEAALLRLSLGKAVLKRVKKSREVLDVLALKNRTNRVIVKLVECTNAPPKTLGARNTFCPPFNRSPYGVLTALAVPDAGL
jgi:hypothetical protein